MSSRIQSVDFVRVVGILAVIVIHTGPFVVKTMPRGVELDIGTILNQLARFAVPFFFVVSGFFWASRFETEEDVGAVSMKMAKRIAIIFVAWSAIYLLPTNIIETMKYGPLGPLKAVYWNIYQLWQDPVTAVFQGSKVHLWFLVSLLCCLAISSALITRTMTRTLVAIALLLYFVGLAGKAYAETPIGFHINFNFRNGPFFGLIFFVSGYLLQRKGPKQSWIYLGLVLTVLGFVVHFLELLILQKYWGVTMVQDFVIGTYFTGVGVALIGLSNSRIIRFKPIAFMGPMVLGIYAMHFVFVDLLQPFSERFSGLVAWELGYPVLVLSLSLTTTYAISRVSYMRKIVT